MVLELNKENLKAGNYVTIQTSSDLAPSSKIFEVKLKIMSELKKVIVLENMYEISKETCKPYNFCGEILKIESNK